MATVKDISVAQLQAVLIQCTAVLRQQCNDDDEGIDASSYTQVSTAAVAAIERVSGAGSVYSERARYHINHTMYYTSTMNHLMGLVRALLNDVEAGFVHAIKEIAHAELFSDFMLMADFLLKEGYKDAAAVMIGGCP